jgi:lysine N6-hydroxylase
MTDKTDIYDLVGIGIGPFNLALAALSGGVPGLRTLFLDEKPEFSWHAGMLLDGTILQVPFLADLVTLIDPTSPWSFLSYLREHDRLFPFYFTERFHIPRREYDDYCRWVARSLSCCRWSARAEAVRWDADQDVFTIQYTNAGTGQARSVLARDLVLGIGTAPVIPSGLTGLLGDRVFHTADYLPRRPGLTGLDDVTVIGSGQSGAEVLLDLVRTPPVPGARLRWLTRSPAFAPMEYSKLGLEHFTPDYTRYFHALPGQVRDHLMPSQWQLYKAISSETIGQIYDLLYDRAAGGEPDTVTLLPDVEVISARRRDNGLELACHHAGEQRDFVVVTDAVILGTGYAPRRPRLLDPLTELIDWDGQGRYRVGIDYRVAMRPEVTGRLYVQNAELHTHGVGTPDLGLGAHRAAVILNSVTGRTAYRLPRRAAFTTFGAPQSPGQTEPDHSRYTVTAPEAARVPADAR